MSQDNQSKQRSMLNLNRRELLLGATGVGAALAFGTSTASAADEAPVKGGHLVVGLAGGASSDSLDPTFADAQVAAVMIKQISDHLIYPAANGRDLEPMLAESWDHSSDLKQWNFKIRKGVTFHNGKSLSAKDVVFSINRHRGPTTKSGGAAALSGIADVKIEGDHEITIVLNQADVDFPYNITDYHLCIQPDGDPGNSGIGTGAYMLDSAAPGSRYVTKKFKDHWNPSAGFVDSIETIVINDNTARMSALLNGQLHLINKVEPKIVHLLKNSSAVQIVPTSGRGHYSFAMRCDAPPFDNAALRMALKLAIDRESLVQTIMQGYGVPGNDTPINNTYPFATTFLQRKYDPEEAARLYKKSGHSGPIQLHTSDVAFAGAVDAAALFKEHAAKAGITIDVIREPGDGYWSDVWNKKPFCATYWDGRATQAQALALAYKSDAPWNDTAWKRPEFDKLLSEAASTTVEAVRVEKYKKASQMIMDDGGAIIPIFAQYIDAISAKLGGFVPDVNNEVMNGRFHEKVWLKA
jgi:peptide/nickel transport system substrate-binding protein